MEGADGAAAVAIGGLAAREVDRAGTGAHVADRHHFADATCRNCGTGLIGSHCHACGQGAHLHRDLMGFVHDILHGVFHFDGKFWSTLPLLALRPGELTRRYVDGERQRFVTPMAMFLFSLFLMFAVASNVSGLIGASGPEIARADLNDAQRQIGRGVEAADARLARLQAARTRAASGGRDTTRIDAQIADQRQRREGLVAAGRLLPGGTEVSPRVRARATGAAEPGDDVVKAWFEAKVAHVRENPKLFLYKMKTSGYKYSWALIPLSLPFLWLMFAWRRRFGMYDHAVFATYSIAAMSLLVVALSLVASLGDLARGLSWTALFVLPPIHMYRQLRGGYRLTRFSAGWRTVVLLGVVSFTSVLFFLFLLWLGLAG